MNAPIRFAQVSSKEETAPVHIIKLIKPADGQAVTVKTGYEGKVRIDFSGIADERISIVRVGETAVIYFHGNKSTITLDPFFGSNQWPLANLEFQLGPDRVFGAQEIAALLPFTVYQGILPAADGQAGNEQDSGANFNPAIVAELPPIVLNELMPPEVLPPVDFRADISPAQSFAPLAFAGLVGIVEEEHLANGVDSPFGHPILSEGNEDGNGTPSEDEDADPDFDNTTHQFTAQIEITGGSGVYSFSLLPGALLNLPQSQGQPIAYEISGNVLTGFVDSGTTAGALDNADRVVFTLEVSPTGLLTFTVYDQIDHPIAGIEDILGIDFSGLIEVNDPIAGSSLVLGGVVINVIDDVPLLARGTESAEINENDIATPWSLGTSPFDGAGDGSDTEFNGLVNPAIITGNLAGLVRFGSDEHPAVTDKPMFGFIDEADVIAYMEGLGLASKQVAGAAFPGIPLTYAIGTSGDWIVLTAAEPDSPAGGTDTSNIVFELRINQLTGDYEFRLFDELTHALPDGIPGGLDERLPVDFGAILEALDYDGDPVSLAGSFVITVIDDVPEPVVKLNPLGVVQHDESAGVQPANLVQFLLDPADSDTNAGAVKALFAHLETFVAVGDDPDIDGDSNGGVAGNGPIGYARSLLPVVLENLLASAEGADSPATKNFSLAILDANSGLAVTDGSPIMLQIYDNGTADPADDLIIGRVNGGAFDGEIAFAIDIDDDGFVSLAQYLSLFHPTPGSSHDETVDLDGKIGAIFTISDTDGDTASTGPINIGGNVRFDDDGPSVTVKDQASETEKAQLKLVLDETLDADRYNAGESESNGGAPNGAADDTGKSLPLVISTNPTSADAIGSRITAVTGGLGALFNVSIAFGSDGALPGNPRQDSVVHEFGFDLNGSGTTNLVVTEQSGTTLEGVSVVNRTIFLVDAGPGVIEGRIRGADGAGGDDYVAFRITILNPDDPANAQIRIEQFLAIDHDASEPAGQQGAENPSLFDEQINLLLPGVGNNLQLVLTTTVTDGDGDTATDSDSVTLIDRSNSIVAFDDDGPVITGVTYANAGGQELLTNADFTADDDFIFNDNNTWGDPWGGFDPNGITGWTVAWSNIGGGSGNPRIERKGDTYLGMNAGGLPMMDMAATPGNLQISQNVTVVDGASYTLTFMAGAPEPGSAILQVIWNGDVILTLDFTTGTLPAQMTEYSISVVGDGTLNTLSFKEIGSAAANSSSDNVGGNHGTYLANVSLTQQSQVLDDEDTTLSPAIENQGGPGDDGNGVVASGKINFDAGTDGLQSIAVSAMAGLSGIFVNDAGIGKAYAITQVWHAGVDASGNTPGYEQGGTLVGTMQTDDEGAQRAFTIEVKSDGTFVFTLIAPLNHGGTDNPDTPGITETSWEDNLELDFEFTITDGDDDTASGTLSFTVDDDSPVATVRIADGTLIHDETPGKQPFTDDLGDDAGSVSEMETLFSAVAGKGDDAHVAGAGAIGYARDELFYDLSGIKFGADGAGSTPAFSLTLSQVGVFSGLKTTEGYNIVLTAEDYGAGGKFIVGRVVGGSDDGDAAFAIMIDPATGEITLAQYLSILHDDQNDHDEANDDGSPGDDEAPVNNPIPVQQTLAPGVLSVTVTVVDGDGDSVSASTDVSNRIIFRDDGPDAVDDAAREVAENGAQISGDVLANDSRGADGAVLTHAKLPGGDFVLITSGTPLGGGLYQFIVDGVGTYSFNSAGTWTFKTVAAVGADTTATFEYRLTDGDGDWDDATQPITVLNSNTLPTAGTATAFLDDEGLAFGITGNGSNSGNTDAVTSAPEHADSGFLPFNFNGETPGEIRLVDGAELVGGVNYTYDANPAGDSLTVKADGVDYMTVTLNQATGAYTVTLLNAINHPSNHSEDNVVFNIKYEVEDSSGDIATGTLVVDVDDDTPVAQDDSAAAVAGVTNFNIAFVLDYSGSIDSIELNTQLTAVKAAAQAIYNNATGSVDITVIGFGETAANLGTFINYAAFAAAIDLTNVASGGTDFTAAVTSTIANYALDANAVNQIYFISDGNPNEQTGPGGTSLTVAAATAWNTFINGAIDVGVQTIGIGNGITTERLQDVEVEGGSPLLIAEFSNLINTLLTLINGSSASGNVLLGTDGADNAGNPGGDDDGFGADDGRVLSITIDGVEYTYTPGGVPPIAGAPNETDVVSKDSTSITIETPLGGNFTFHFVANGPNAAGDWTYSPGANAGDETIGYTIIDNDGDQASATLTIDVQDPNSKPDILLNNPASNFNYRDEFTSVAFNNSNGTAAWASTPWTESSDNGNAGTGTIRIDSGQLRLGANGDSASIERTVNLTGATSATLTFNFGAVNTESGEEVHVYFSTDGTTWGSPIGSFEVGETPGAINLTGPFGPNSKIRFEIESMSASDEYLFIDDVNVAYTVSTNPTFTEDGAAVVIMPNATLTDPDNPANFNGGLLNVAITGGVVAGDGLFVSGAVSISGGTNVMVGATQVGTVANYGTANLTIAFNTNATDALVETVLKSIAFDSESNNPGTSRQITVTFNDGGNTGPGGPLSDTEVITVNVVPSNDNPTATDNVLASTTEAAVDTATDGSLVLGNIISGGTPDSDPDGGTLSVTGISALTVVDTDAELVFEDVTELSAQAGEAARYQIRFDHPGAANQDAILVVTTNGSVEIYADGSEDPFRGLGIGESATINFTYTLSDGQGGTDTGDVSFVVNGSNDAPVANDETVISIFGNSSFTVPAWAFLVNDFDPDGDPLTFSSVNDANNMDSLSYDSGTGLVTINYDGSGTGSFDYVLSDGTTTVEGDVTYSSDTSSPLTGTGGDDIIVGNGNGQTIDGNGGRDVMFGGGGADIFDFNSTADSGNTIATADIIGDWSSDDLINLEDIDTNPGGTDQDFTYGGQTTALLNDTVTWYHQEGNTIIQMDTNGNLTSPEMMLVLTGIHTLTSGNFDT